MPSFEELLNQLLEAPEEVLASLNDVVSKGRIQADDLDGEALQVLAHLDLVSILVQRTKKGPVRSWIYPSPMGLKTFAFLEREAERVEETQVVKVKRRGRRDTGVSR